jgi:HK97 family phage major capsid protein
MSENSGVLGGYLAPQEYSFALFRTIAENSFIEPRALVVPMKTAETLTPKINSSAVPSAGTSPFFGGIHFAWLQTEGQNLPDATGTLMLSSASLKAWDLVGTLPISNQLMDDLTEEGVEQLLDLFGRAAAWHKEYAFLRGMGAGNSQPLGILNSDACLSVTRAGATAIAIADVSEMSSKLIPYSWNHSIWACSPSALKSIAKITGFVPNMDPLSTEMGCAGSLMTRPLFVTEKLPALGTRGDLLLFDPSLYAIGNRQDVTIEVSYSPGFRTQQAYVKVWIRCDGKPLMDTYATLSDGTSTASAFVALN